MLKIIEEIERLRKERGWTVYKLAQEADFAQQTYHKWLDGKALPSYKTLEIGRASCRERV